MNSQFVRYKWDAFKFNKNRQVTTKKMFVSIAAFFASLVFASFFILTQGANPFEALETLFSTGFNNMLGSNGSLVEMSIAAISALSFIIASRSGMFNVAATGQLWGAAILVYLVGQYMGNVPIVIGQIIMIIIAASFGVVSGIFITWLKTRFNVNEVVSSILFNYLVYFVGWFMLTEFLVPVGTGTSISLSDNLRLFDASTQSAWIPGVVLMVIILFGTWFLFKYTKMGWKIKAVGLSKNGAQYSGYNVNAIRMGAMSVSGAISGILGLLIYTGLFPSIQVPISNTLPSFGFNGIAIGLLALWNPIGIGFFSFFVGVLSAGKANLVLIGASPIFMDLILGIIIFGSALITGLIVYKPWLWLIKKKIGDKKFNNWIDHVELLGKQIDICESKIYDNWHDFSKKIVSSWKNNTFGKEFKIYQKNKAKIINDYFAFKGNKKHNVSEKTIKQNENQGVGS